MKYVDSILNDGENIVHSGSLHWIIFTRPIIYFLVGIICIIAMIYSDTGGAKAAWSFVAIFPFLSFSISTMIAGIKMSTTEIAITNRRLIYKEGLIRRDTAELNHGKIESIDIKQGILGRILDYGDTTIVGTGGTSIPIINLAAPLSFRKRCVQEP